MKILEVRVQNFRLHADTRVEFSNGVTGIIGANESGKSTLATEALLWAFYGGTAVRGTMDSVRWKGAPPRKTASVEVRFEIGGVKYRVERGESTAKLWQSDEENCWSVIAQGTAPVNKMVPEIIGMSHDEFTTSYLVKQKEVNRIATMLPTERQGFIRQVMGVGRIDVALKNCRKRKSELSKEKDALSMGLGRKEGYVETRDNAKSAHRDAIDARESASRSVADAAKELAEAEALFASEDEKAREKKSILDELARVAGRIGGVDTEIDRLSRRLHEAEEAKKEVEAYDEKLKKLPEEQERLEKMEAAAKASRLHSAFQSMADKSIAMDKQKEEYEAIIAAYDPDADVKAQEREREATEALNAKSSWRQEKQTRLLTLANQAEFEAGVMQGKASKLEEAGASGECPTCTRTLGDEFRDVVAHFIDQAHIAIQKATELRDEADALTQETEDEVEARERLQELRATLRAFVEQRSASNVALASLQALRQRKEEHDSHAHDLAKEIEALFVKWGPLVGEPSKEEMEAVEKKVRELQALASGERYGAVRFQASQIQNITNDLAESMALRKQLVEEEKEWEAKSKECPFSQENHEAAKAWLEEKQESNRKAVTNLAVAEERERGTQAALNAAEKALREYEVRESAMKAIEQDHLTHERAAARLADFRVAIAATIRPEMEELMSGFIHLLTDGRHESVELSEDFTATLYESGVPVEVVSGGTEDITALAMRLALSQMIAERAGHPLSLLVLDEPFGSLDETRRANVITLIRNLRSVFEQVIVISHVAETKDAVDFVVELEYDERTGSTRRVAA